MPRFFRLTLAALALCAAAGAQAQPQPAPNAALERVQQAKTAAEVLTALGVSTPEPGRRVLLEAPDIAVAGRAFTVKVSSQMAGTDWILILSEPGPTPLVKLQEFSPGADRSLVASLKLTQTGRVRAIVRTSGKYYQVTREVKIATPGGDVR